MLYAVIVAVIVWLLGFGSALCSACVAMVKAYLSVLLGSVVVSVSNEQELASSLVVAVPASRGAVVAAVAVVRIVSTYLECISPLHFPHPDFMEVLVLFVRDVLEFAL